MDNTKDKADLLVFLNPPRIKDLLSLYRELHALNKRFPIENRVTWHFVELFLGRKLNA